MRRCLLTATALLLLVAPVAAGAAEPIMPLSDVRAGMRCTGLSVVRGADIASFDVEVVDVVEGDPIARQPLLLVRVSGPVVDASGIAEGFSGSPVVCDGRIAGAIAYGSGDYGNRLGYATPIEEMLGQPVPTPPGARRDPALRHARPLATPIAVSGVAPAVFAPFARAAARTGLRLVAVPASPVGDRFPSQRLEPGSSVAVGLSSGAVTSGAVGTVTYVDGDRVWAFGHPYQAAGVRSLLLQDAWVYTVVDNPLGLENAVSSKLAAPGHDLGTLTYDGRDGVFGVVGTLPPRIELRIATRNAQTGATHTATAQVADETAVGLPGGGSPVKLVAPMATAQAAYAALDGSPVEQTARMCVRITMSELRRPTGFCNRYVGAFGGEGRAGGPYLADLTGALDEIDAFAFGTPHVGSVEVALAVQPGLQQALLRGVRGPKRVRRGSMVTLRLELQLRRGPRFTRAVRLRVPRDAPLGRRTMRLAGTPLDGPVGADELQILLGPEGVEAGGGATGPRTFAGLARRIAALHSDDGVRVRFAGAGGRRGARWQPLYRDPRYRISGDAGLRVTVTR